MAGALAGTMNAPDHDPFAATARRRRAGPAVVADTCTKSWLDDKRRPGEQPVPLTCTDVPGGPEVGAIAKVCTAAPALDIRTHAAPEAKVSATVTTMVRRRRDTIC
jgi:hypothetical protein